MENNFASSLYCFKHPTKKVEAVCVLPECCYYRFFCTKCFIENVHHLTTHQSSLFELPALMAKHKALQGNPTARGAHKYLQGDKPNILQNMNGTLSEINNNLDKHKTFVKQTEGRLGDVLDNLKTEFKNSLDMIKANFSDILQSTVLKYENRYSHLIQKAKEISAQESKQAPTIIPIENVNWKNQACVETFFLLVAQAKSPDPSLHNNIEEQGANLTDEIEQVLDAHERFFRDNNLLDNYTTIQETVKELGLTIKQRLFQLRDLILHNQPVVKLTRERADFRDHDEDVFGKETRKKVKKDTHTSYHFDDQSRDNLFHTEDMVHGLGLEPYPGEERRTLKKPVPSKIHIPKMSPFKLTSRDTSEALMPAWAERSLASERRQSSAKKKKIIGSHRKQENMTKGGNGQDAILNNCLMAMGLTPLRKNSVKDPFIKPKKIDVPPVLRDICNEEIPPPVAHHQYNWNQPSMLNIMSPAPTRHENFLSTKPLTSAKSSRVLGSKAPGTSPKRVSLRESSFYLDSVNSSHKEGITSIALIKGYFATASFDSTIKLWDIHTFQLVKTLKGHKSWVTCLASTDFDQKVSIPNSSAGSYIECSYASQSTTTKEKFETTPELLLISGGLDFEIKIWDISRDSPEIGSLKGHYQMITCLKTFKYANRLLASSSRDKNIKLWDLRTHQCIYTKAEHSDWITCLEIFNSKSLIVSASNDRSIIVWKLVFTEDDILQKCALKSRFSQAHEKSVQSLASSKDERYLISAGEDGVVKLWEIDRGVCIREMFSQRKIPMFKLIFFENLTLDGLRYPAGRSMSYIENEERTIEECVIGSSITGELHIWDLTTGDEVLVCDNGHRYKNVEFPFGDVLKLDRDVKYWKGLLSQEYNMISVSNGNGILHLWKV